MTTLTPADGYLTLINTFTVDPDRADELLDTLSRATQETFVDQPGFVSANLHLSADRAHVANYAQWRSAADYQTAAQRPEVQAHFREAAGIAESFEPIVYELRHAHGATASTLGGTA